MKSTVTHIYMRVVTLELNAHLCWVSWSIHRQNITCNPVVLDAFFSCLTLFFALYSTSVRVSSACSIRLTKLDFEQVLSHWPVAMHTVTQCRFMLLHHMFYASRLRSVRRLSLLILICHLQSSVFCWYIILTHSQRCIIIAPQLRCRVFDFGSLTSVNMSSCAALFVSFWKTSGNISPFPIDYRRWMWKNLIFTINFKMHERRKKTEPKFTPMETTLNRTETTL